MFKKYAIYLSFLFVISFTGKSFSHYSKVIPNEESIRNLENIIQEVISLVPLLDEITFYKNYQFHMTLNAGFIFNNVNLNIFNYDNVYANVKNIIIDIKKLLSSITFKVIDVIPLGNNNNYFIAFQLKPVLNIFSKLEKKGIKKQLAHVLKETPHISIVKCSPDLDIEDAQYLVKILWKHFSRYRIFIQFEQLNIIAEKNNRTLEFMF